MPAIHLLGTKTLSGGDDLHIPCLLAMGLRLFQVILLIITWQAIRRDYTLQKNEIECPEERLFYQLLVSYAASSSVFVVLDFCLEVRLSSVSSRGSPTDFGARNPAVERLLTWKLIPLSLVEFFICLLGASLFVMNQGEHCIHDTDVDNNNYQEETDYDDDFWQEVTSWLYSDSQSNRPASLWQVISWWWLALVVLWLTQVAEVLVACALVIRLGCKRRAAQQEETQHYPMELTEEMWVDRCTSVCRCLGMTTCFLFGGKEVGMGDYGDVARALADYLETGGVLDVVPSDVVMGFWVLQRLQRLRVLHARKAVVEQRQWEQANTTASGRFSPASDPLLPPPLSDAGLEVANSSESNSSHRRKTTFVMHQEGSETFYEATSRKVLSRHRDLDIATLQEGARFAKYALAIYTWMLYVYQHPMTGVPRLMCRRTCCCWNERHADEEQETDELLRESGHIEGDNCCHAHKEALLLHANLDEADLVYAQLKNSFSEVPYCILLDHAWRTVVVAIRGTFSLEDCVTDVLIEPEPLDRLGQEFGFEGDGENVHGGVLSCARIVHRDLQRHGILDRLLLGNNCKYPGYSLRIVGHSLGAATATLLSYMMKEKYPSIRCLNYSPPGCCLTWKLATDCQEFCTSFVLDSDLVPRLSLNSMDHLRDEILDLIGRVKVPKIEVANTVVRGIGLLNCRLCLDGDLEDDGEVLQQSIEDMLRDKDDVPPDCEYQQHLHEFRRIQAERKQQRGESRTIALFPPGRIVHLIKTGEKTSCMHGVAKCLTCGTTNLGAHYTPVWVNNDDLNEIVVSPTMGTDHFPNRVCQEIEVVAEEYCIDTTRGFYPVDLERPIERT